MTVADRVRIRELLHAYDRAASLRSADPKAEEVLAAGRDAAHALQRHVALVLAEEADDPPYRVARDRAAANLRAGAVAAVERYRATVTVEATDPVTGSVVDPGLMDHARSLAETHAEVELPEGGPALQVVAGRIRDGLAARPHGEALATYLTSLLAAHESALVRVEIEADELAAEREELEEARVEADRWRKAGWYYLQYLGAASGRPIDLKAIYPAARARASDAAAADAALTEAGAPEPG